MPVRIIVQGIYPEANVMVKKGDRVLEALKDTLTGEVARRLKSAMKARTRGWDKPPDFKSDLTAQINVFSLLVMPAGSGKIKWERVSGGTPPHTITARRAPVLRIRGGKGGYKPHTRPGNVYGGPGSYTGEDQFAKTVHHPGIGPRNFEEHIVKEEEGWVVRTLKGAADRAAK